MTEEEVDEAIAEHAQYPIDFSFAHERSGGKTGAYTLFFHSEAGSTTLPAIEITCPLYPVATVTLQRVFAKAKLVDPLVVRLAAVQKKLDSALAAVNAGIVSNGPNVRYRVVVCESGMPDQVLLTTADRQAAHRAAGACPVAPGCWADVKPYLVER